jgi:uncharacterized protein (DUF2062 family)
MFRRREKQTIMQRMREAAWPSMGWSRAWDYYRHRLFRRSDSPGQITAGLAIGVGISFVPLLGTHFVQAVIVAWLVRANALAAFIGTAVGNPWTFPLMFWLDYKVGALIFAVLGYGDLAALPHDLTWRFLLDHPLHLFLPMLIGGYLCAVFFFPVAYALLYYPVKMMQKSYRDQFSRNDLSREAKNR